MKNTFLLLSALAIMSFANATDAQLIVQQVPNQNTVPGSTYRLFAQMPDAAHSLHIVFGDAQNPLHIESTAPFYQHPYGGHSALNLNDATLQISSALMYDSYITLGYRNGTDNNMSDIGVDFAAFGDGNQISTNNGGWFLLPTDAKCNAEASGLVFIGQFTTTGIVTGTLNLQGWTGPQQAWLKKGLTFSTANAQIFGCTDASAANYSATATFNDGTCTHNNSNGQTTQSYTQATKGGVETTNTWEVFPNPLRDNLIHVQFKNAIDFKKEITTVEILDMTGRLLLSQNITNENAVGGNRITLVQELSNGTYKVVLTQSNRKETQTLVVQK